jgi:DNA-binding NarL/FixJ family response regulator
MSQAIRVLIADDHAIFRQGLATIINRDPDMQVIAQAENGKQAIALFGEHQPDVTLMDLRMPEVEGVAAIGAICAVVKSARIIPLLSLWENTNAESLSELPSPCFAYKLELLLENKSSKLDYIKVSELC